MLTIKRSAFVCGMFLATLLHAQTVPPPAVPVPFESAPTPPAIARSTQYGKRTVHATVDERIKDIVDTSDFASLVEILREARRIDKQGIDLKKLGATIDAQLFRLEAQRAPLHGVPATLKLAYKKKVKPKLKAIANEKDVQAKRTQLQDLLDEYQIKSIDLQNAVSLEAVEAQIDDLQKLKGSVLSQIAEHLSQVDTTLGGGEATAEVVVDQSGIQNLREKLNTLTLEPKPNDTQNTELNHDLDFLNQFRGD